MSKNFFISRPRWNLYFFAVSIVEFRRFHYGMPSFQLRNSVQWNEAKSAMLLLAAGSIIKYLLNEQCAGRMMCKSLRIVGILRKSAQIPRGPGCASVCSRKYERVFARVDEVTLSLRLSIAGVAPE